jgi:hypothetical protein
MNESMFGIVRCRTTTIGGGTPKLLLLLNWWKSRSRMKRRRDLMEEHRWWWSVDKIRRWWGCRWIDERRWMIPTDRIDHGLLIVKDKIGIGMSPMLNW